MPPGPGQLSPQGSDTTGGSARTRRRWQRVGSPNRVFQAKRLLLDRWRRLGTRTLPGSVRCAWLQRPCRSTTRFVKGKSGALQRFLWLLQRLSRGSHQDRDPRQCHVSNKATRRGGSCRSWPLEAHEAVHKSYMFSGLPTWVGGQRERPALDPRSGRREKQQALTTQL